MITVPAGQKVTDPAVAAATGRRAFAATARAIPGARIADYATTHDPAFVTRGGRSTFALVFTAPVAGYGDPQPRPGHPAGRDGGRARRVARRVTGSPLLAGGQPSSAKKGTGIMAEAMIGSVGALVILALVFASFLALLPLLIGGVSVLATFLLVGGLTEVTGVSQIVEFLIALIGLGVAIDYSLLVVSRWREERAAGRDNEAAVAEAMAHAGRAVVFRPDRGHRAAVDGGPAGAHAAQRRLRRRPGAAGLRGRLRHPAAGDPGHAARAWTGRGCGTSAGPAACSPPGPAASTGTAGWPRWPGSASWPR